MSAFDPGAFGIRHFTAPDGVTLVADVAAPPGAHAPTVVLLHGGGQTRHSWGSAARVLAARGLTGLFDAVYGVEEAAFVPKPERAAFERVFAQDGLDPTRSAMFEDDARNLAVPHALGMRTVHIAPLRDPAPHIHHHSEDLAEFLGKIV